MDAIKEYKEVCVISRKNGDDIQTPATLEEIEQWINNGPQMIRFGDELVNKYEITGVKKKEVSDIDAYIMGITDKEMKNRLKAIVKERNAKGLLISSVKHLMDIYNGRFTY